MLAICHEVGNHLAAARLSAHLLGRGTRRADSGSHAIEAVATEAAALLAQVRPLLGESAPRPIQIPALSLLESLAREVESLRWVRDQVRIELPRSLPDVRVDPGILQPLLLALILRARESRVETAPVRLTARPASSRVVFELEELGPSTSQAEAADEASLRGSLLALRIAERVLAPFDGRVSVRTRNGRARVELSLPAASTRGERPPRPRRPPSSHSTA